MSSTYKVLCLSHDPATLVAEFNKPEDAQNAISYGIDDHPRCDFLISRVSGAPVEFGCPGSALPDRDARVCSGHYDVRWESIDILRLLAHVRSFGHEDSEKLLNRAKFRCWSNERLFRIRHDLELS